MFGMGGGGVIDDRPITLAVVSCSAQLATHCTILSSLIIQQAVEESEDKESSRGEFPHPNRQGPCGD